MNARLNEGNILSAAKRILGFAGLASLVLVCAGAAWAQAQPSQAQSTAAPSGATVPATSPGIGPSESAPAAKQVMAQNPSTKPSAPKGQSEGIKVHGHWIIEVRDPDGKLANRREFENSLLGTGAALLTSLLGRTVTQGSWEIILVTSSNASMHITEPNSTLAAICNYAACSNNLSVVPGTAQSPGVLTFAGFVAVPAGQTSVIQVQTNSLACVPSVLPANCVNAAINGGNWTDYGLTQFQLSPAINITPGQVVQAAVTISFQ